MKKKRINPLKKRVCIALAFTILAANPHFRPNFIKNYIPSRLISISYASTTTNIMLDVSDLDIVSNKITGFSASGQSKYNAAKTDANYDKIELDFSAVPATEIGENAFLKKFLDKNTIVRLPYTLETIQKKAFAGNTSLNTVEFNPNIKTIGEQAFFKSSISGDLILPDSVKTIEKAAFRDNKISFVKIPDGIEVMLSEVFANNMIENIDFGSLANIKGVLWSSQTNPTPAILSHDIFRNNHLTELKIENTGIRRTGSNAFRGNRLTKVVLQSNISMLNYGVFQDNPNLTTIRVAGAENAPHNQIAANHINGNAFKGANLSGKLEFLNPSYIEINSSHAFEGNSITELIFQPNVAVTTGPYSFKGNPIETLELPKAVIVENGVYYNTGTLKNVNFDKYNKNEIVAHMFSKGKLRSLEIPSTIDKIGIKRHWVSEDDLQGKTDGVVYPNMSFSGNIGWFDNDTKVALYRKTKGTDGKLSSGEYITDNALTDGYDYVFNPVLVEFEFVDQNDNKIQNTLIPASMTVNKTRNFASSSSTTDINNFRLENSKDFKLDDEIKIEKSSLPIISNYTLKEVSVGNQKINENNNSYIINLDPSDTNIVKEEKYTDINKNDIGYEVGFKKTTIKIKYNVPTPTPPVVTPPSTPPIVVPPVVTPPSTPPIVVPPVVTPPIVVPPVVTPPIVVPPVVTPPSTPPIVVPPVVTPTPNPPSSGGVNEDNGNTSSTTTTAQTTANIPTPTPSVQNIVNNLPSTPETPQVAPQITPAENNVNQGETNDNSSAIHDVPDTNPPINIPFVPNEITNAELIPADEQAVFTIINSQQIPLGTAIIDAENQTYTFIDDDATPLGVAKINDNNTLEIVEIFEDVTPLALPKTGEQNSFIQLLGFILIAFSVIIRKKKN